MTSVLGHESFTTMNIESAIFNKKAHKIRQVLAFSNLAFLGILISHCSQLHIVILIYFAAMQFQFFLQLVLDAFWVSLRSECGRRRIRSRRRRIWRPSKSRENKITLKEKYKLKSLHLKQWLKANWFYEGEEQNKSINLCFLRLTKIKQTRDQGKSQFLCILFPGLQKRGKNPRTQVNICYIAFFLLCVQWIEKQIKKKKRKTERL